MRERWNKWYDSLKEPGRFLFFLALVTPACIGLASKNPTAKAVSMAYMLWLLFFRASHLHRMAKEK